MSKMINRSHLLLSLPLLALLPFLLVSVYYIAGHHVWPLSRDQWHMYAPYFEYGLWETMLSPMSTHRHIFPFFLFHMDMVFFNGLNHFLVACGAFFNGLIIYLLLKSLFKEGDLSLREKFCLAIFIVTELIWLLNIAQLGWGFMSTQYYLAIFTFLFAIYSAHQFFICNQGRVWAVLCISCGVISTFSFGMGILTWPCLLYFIWVWRAPLKYALPVIAALFLCLLLFFFLPGGDEVEGSLLLNPHETIRFTLQLASGPIYFLLKSWRIFDLETCKQIASLIGVSASISGIVILAWSFWRRPSLSAFKLFCHALILLGLGTAALISFSRLPNFLDVWVDRYQIWATIFWTGFLPYLYFILKNFSLSLSRLLVVFLVSLPLLAFPSQLDMGSRLYEYKTRVQEALLFYQVGIPDKEAAQDALHWNWEHKLPYFFYVLEKLKKQNKNIYYENPAEYLGEPLEALSGKWSLSPATLSAEQIMPIKKDALLSAESRLALQQFPWLSPVETIKIVGYQITAKLPEDISWKYAVSVSNENIINGIGVHIYHSALPRPSKNFTKRNYNFYAVIRGETNGPVQWYLVKPQASSR